MNLSIQLAWRFRQTKQNSGFISFISGSSTLGIALGCLVLILLLSVMNGFERELKERLLAYIPHGELFAYDGKGIVDWHMHVNQFKKDPEVVSVEPYVKAAGLLQKGTSMKAIGELVGIDPGFSQSNPLVAQLKPEHWQNFLANEHSVLLGAGILRDLKLSIGDKVQLLLPQVSDDLSFAPPKTLWLTVAGQIQLGGELDGQLGFMHLPLAAETMGVTTGASGIRFYFNDPFAAPEKMRAIGYAFEQYVYMSDWTRTQGHLYQDIQLVRAVVYLVLSLVIAVACFNIVSSLVMSVSEKQGEIAMLKTMGARDSLIVRVFMLQGALNGLIGTSLGVVLGVVLAQNLTPIAKWIESISGHAFLSGDIYFINFLPSQLNPTEVVITAMIALSLSFLATIYPAYKATQIEPARALGQQ